MNNNTDNTEEIQNSQEYTVPYDELTITNSFMFGKVFNDEEIAKDFIQNVLKLNVDKINIVREASAQNDFLHKGVRYDVYVKEQINGKTGRVFDVELQVFDTLELPLRARYYQSMCDIDTLEKGASYDELKEQYIIFICKEDIFKAGKSIYTFENREETDPAIKLGDKTFKKYYIFGKYREMKDKIIQEYMEYFATSNPRSNITQKINNRVKWYKSDNTTRKAYMIWQEELKMKFKAGERAGLAQGEKERLNLQDEVARLQAEIERLRAGRVSEQTAEYKP